MHFLSRYLLASFWFLLLTLPAEGQLLQKRPTIELACKHIFPISQGYLDRHVNYSALSKSLETRTIDQLLERLDGSKIYFLKSDTAKLQESLKGIFEKTKKGDCAPVLAAHVLFKERVAQRVAFAKTYLGPKFVLDKKTELMLDPEHRKYAVSKKEAEDFLRKYVQFQVANYVASDMKLDEAKEQVVRNYDRTLRRIGEYKETDLWAIYLDAFARALDPHSSYLSRDALEDFEIQMRLSLEGIGATLSSQDGFTVIEQLVPGGAADLSGQLKPKDKIIAVAQDEGIFQNVIEMDLRDVVRLIRGKKGTKVRLTVLRKDEKATKRFVVSLLRDKIRLEDEAASLQVIDKEIGNTKKKIGLVNLPSFYADGTGNGRSAAKDVKDILKKVRESKLDGVVLDLSTNGGGSLEDAVRLAGLFFKTGNVVKQSSKDPAKEELALADDDPEVDYSGPLVVLISRVSASASEIVAGTLKDYHRAVVVGGDHTFGKGTVQSVEPLPPGLGALKTTVGMFFTPGGRSTQHIGVDTDIPMPSVYSTNEIGEKNLDYSLPPKTIPAFLSPQAYVTAGGGAWKMVDGNLIKQLKDQSTKRVARSEDFKKIADNLKKVEKKGRVFKISEVLDEKKDKKKESGGDLNPDAELEESATGKVLTREEKLAKYLKRADIQEAVSIVADYVGISEGLSVPMTIGAKGVGATKPTVTETPKIKEEASEL